MAINSGLELNDALGLCVGLLLKRRSVFHRHSETIIRCCGGRPYLGGLEGVGERSFAEHGAALVVFLCIIALKFVPLLIQLPREVGLCCPPRLVGGLFLVVQEFGLEQATGIHMGHNVVQLVIVGDCDPMAFTLYLAPVQLARKCCDVCFGSVTL